MKYKDPNRKQEAEKYGRPIPSREFILEQINKADSPRNFRQLVQLLEMRDEYETDALKRRLRAMERDGQLLYNRKGQYIPVKAADLVAGRIIGHPDGFGFVVPDDGSDDLYLSNKQMRRTMHGDRILASVSGVDRKGRREGIVIEVLEHHNKTVVGRFIKESSIGFIVPDNKRLSQDILIPPDAALNAINGQIVLATITEPPTAHRQPIGRITEVLGEHMAPGMEIDIALRSHSLPHIWPQEVEQEISHLHAEIDPSDIPRRVDYRSLPLVTIDGEDSRDFDDAVYCEREGRDWRLLVAIADVSHYVDQGSALDQEAFNRGTSVYFPKQVIPMLPEILSNGLCSLNPKSDRYCMVADIRMTQNGELKSFDFHEGVMNSAARLTYTEMAALVIDKDKETRAKRRGLNLHLDNLYKLFRILRRKRTKRGAIDFETQETRILFSENRKIEKILPTERNDAHKLIEECMILANVCAAKFLLKHKIPNLHRSHPKPETNKVDDLRNFLGNLSFSLPGGDTPHPKDYSHILEQVRARPDANLIQTVLLRSLSQASYTPNAVGHFGLALDEYAHFTSPIRRYPDLLVHRGIRHYIRNRKHDGFGYTLQDMTTLGEHCSMAERRAEDASRDVTSWLKCEYMMDKVGESFYGIISSVTSFGLFVELEDIFVEGLIHVTALDNDYYQFDPIHHKMRGERTGKVFQLGNRIEIQVARVDLDERKIDFMLAHQEAGKKKRSPHKKQHTGQDKKGASKNRKKDTRTNKNKGKPKNKTKPKKRPSR